MGLVHFNGIWNDLMIKPNKIEQFHQSTANYDPIHLYFIIFRKFVHDVQMCVSRGEIRFIECTQKCDCESHKQTDNHLFVNVGNVCVWYD